MNKSRVFSGIRLVFSALMGILILFALIALARFSSTQVHAAPIDPPEGYPKFNTSTMVVLPTLAHTGGATLQYVIEIRNTGAYTAENVTLSDAIPVDTTYNGDAWASSSSVLTYTNGLLLWEGDVGFDSTVVISFSVTVSQTFEGLLRNTALIEHPQIAQPVTVAAETMVTELPILAIEKTSVPEKPGPGKHLTYMINVTNQGQPRVDLPVVVTDVVPLNTQFSSAGPDGSEGPAGIVTWERQVTLDTGESSVFTFTVDVNEVPSGTVIANTDYQVANPESGLAAGEPYTVTVIDPILYIHKSVQPYPPGSNREMTYTLTVLNKGSLATDLMIEDRVPDGVDYVSGGDSLSDGVVSWELPELDTDESAQFVFTVYIGDVADIEVLNADYSVCSAEGVCQYGSPLYSLVQGPTFDVTATVYPIAKKPGGGSIGDQTTVTPTFVIENLGPGSALDAVAQMYFERISVSFTDLAVIPSKGTLYVGPDCGEKCDSYIWIGDLAFGETITLTTVTGQSTIGGEEGTHYTATVVLTDTLGAFTTEPITGTAIGNITHYANLIPSKTAPPVVGAGQVLTYTIDVDNSGLSTVVPPYPWLTDTVPLSTTLVSVSNDGVVNELGDQIVISWTLPAMSPGDNIEREFAVLVDPDLVSGTEIVNSQYGTAWTELISDTNVVFSNTGEPVSTIVKEVGLIDSFKTVTPTMVPPGSGNVLTYTVNIVNSGPSYLHDVSVYDLFPWEHSTYQRDAVASAGQLSSDIVSLIWTGDVGPFSSEVITFSVVVDDDYQGPIVNTAYIDHTSLREPVIVQAVAYATDQPILRITKTATPDPVPMGEELLYTIKVSNLGQEATNLVVTDMIPDNTEYVMGSSSDGGVLIGGQLLWEHLVLGPGEQHLFMFRVKVQRGNQVINDQYQVSCAEGVDAVGEPVITPITIEVIEVYLPIIFR